MSSPDFLLVEHAQALQALVDALEPVTWVAVDTEFERDDSFFPKLCLIQVATADQVACIDPLRLEDLSPLWQRLRDPDLLKVFHAARQDLEVLWLHMGEVPAPVFDTQMAAPLLGLPDQVGYANLVQGLLGVHLDKGHTRSDWSRRPLPPEQLRYAADDVRFLARLYPKIRDDLAARGRLDWLQEDFAELADPEQFRPDSAEAWRRIKAADRLRDRQLAALQALAAWREEQARKVDKPRNWILRDDVLLSLAQQQPRDRQSLAHIRGLHERQAQRFGAEIIALLAKARDQAPPQRPGGARPIPLEPAEDALVDTLMAALRLLAAEHGVNPSVLGTRKDLERLLRGEGDSPLLHGWRGDLAGRALLEILQGRRALVVEGGRLRLTDTATAPVAGTLSEGS